jgi:hypothetical protein
LGRNQGVATFTDQIGPACRQQGLPYLKIVFGLEELHQGPLHPPVPQIAGDIDLLLREWV